MDDRVRKIIDLLENSRYRTTSLPSLAAAVGLSDSRLSHLFKHNTSLSIRSFIQARRLASAAHLIATTDRRISEILYEVGFTDPSNFNHAFKLHYRVSPREYRRTTRSRREKSAADYQPDARTQASFNYS